MRLQREPFDVAAEAAKLTRGRSDVGALVTFTGICRGSEAASRSPRSRSSIIPAWRKPRLRATSPKRRALAALGVTVIHRYGRITPGEDIVMVVTRRRIARLPSRRPSSSWTI